MLPEFKFRRLTWPATPTAFVMVPVDPEDPHRGFAFDGRLNEDFKLTTGVWVSVGPLRAAFLDAFQPLVRDVAIAGEARDEVAALVFPDLAACRALCGEAGDDAGILAHPAVRQDFARRLARSRRRRASVPKRSSRRGHSAPATRATAAASKAMYSELTRRV